MVSLSVRIPTHLTDDVPVSETDYQTVFRCVVLVLVLCNEALTSIIIGFALYCTLNEGKPFL